MTNLWKTETQDRLPETHFVWYFSKVGSMLSKKGPTKGIFQVLPGRLPLFLRYETGRRVSLAR